MVISAVALSPSNSSSRKHCPPCLSLRSPKLLPLLQEYSPLYSPPLLMHVVSHLLSRLIRIYPACHMSVSLCLALYHSSRSILVRRASLFVSLPAVAVVHIAIDVHPRNGAMTNSMVSPHTTYLLPPLDIFCLSETCNA